MSKPARVNDRIRVPRVRVIGEDGEQLGVVSIEEALETAGSKDLDLVEVAPLATPPVCRIMDYSKYKYEQEKREREARKKQRLIQVKEIKIKPKIEEHDYQVKLHNLLRFLKRGDRVKVTLWFRGREMAHQEIGREIMNRVAKDVSMLGEIDRGPVLEGRHLVMIIVPK